MSGRQSSAVDKALRLVANGLNPHAASRKAGISYSTIWRALKRAQAAKAIKRQIEGHRRLAG